MLSVYIQNAIRLSICTVHLMGINVCKSISVKQSADEKCLHASLFQQYVLKLERSGKELNLWPLPVTYDQSSRTSKLILADGAALYPHPVPLIRLDVTLVEKCQRNLGTE